MKSFRIKKGNWYICIENMPLTQFKEGDHLYAIADDLLAYSKDINEGIFVGINDAKKYFICQLEESPKFGIGDKVQFLPDHGTIMTIEKIENNEYIFANGGGHVSIKEGNKWTLVEANHKFKEGDIVINMVTGEIRSIDKVKSDGYLFDDDSELSFSGEEYWDIVGDNSVWHEIDELPEFRENLEDGTPVTPLIIDRNYDHISARGAHRYTKEKWEQHIDFETHRMFKWAYEEDLIKL